MDTNSLIDQWYVVDNVQDVFTPALLVYPDRVDTNILKMIEMAGDARMLRPHVKTHKIPDIVRMQISHGINKFKCATIAESEMVGRTGAGDILLAMQPVGPNVDRFFRLKKEFPQTRISCIVDSPDAVLRLSGFAAQTGMSSGVWIDLNVGMNRTGITPDRHAVDLFRLIMDQPMLQIEGLHAYDGHIHEKTFAERRRICDAAFEPVTDLLSQLESIAGIRLPVVAGGTPTFPIHAGRRGVETSPGTLLLWDYGYSSSYTDLEFLHSAVLLTRIVSKPGENLICLDLGHKAVASEMPQPRVMFLNLENYSIIGHNEEHMVVSTEDSYKLHTGDVLYGIPFHICPTVDRYDTVTAVRDGRAIGEWSVEARRRKISI